LYRLDNIFEPTQINSDVYLVPNPSPICYITHTGLFDIIVSYYCVKERQESIHRCDRYWLLSWLQIFSSTI